MVRLGRKALRAGFGGMVTEDPRHHIRLEAQAPNFPKLDTVDAESSRNISFLRQYSEPIGKQEASLFCAFQARCESFAPHRAIRRRYR